MSRQRRYRKFTNTKSRATFIEALSRGLPVTAACKAAGWYQPDVYKWRKDDEKFAEEWEVALDQGIGILEQEALRRATIGREISVTDPQGNLISITRTPPSDLLLMFLLKAKRPDIYRETFRHDITNSDNSLVAFANAMNMLEDPNYMRGLPPPIDVTPLHLGVDDEPDAISPTAPDAT